MGSAKRTEPRRSPAGVLGDRIRSIRNERKLSRRVIAELAGIHENTLKKIESGEGNPTIGVLLRIAEALDVNASELFRPFDKRR